MWAPLFHRVANAVAARHHRRFRRALTDPQTAQRAALARVLGYLESTGRMRHAGLDGKTSYEDFVRRCGAGGYEELRSLISTQRLRPSRALLAPGPIHFVPTSGSTSARKWIPATPGSGREFDAAAGAWMGDLARRHRGILDGRHYWSLSWLPDEMRVAQVENDDLRLLPPLRRRILERTMAVPSAVSQLGSAAASRRATLLHLAACRDLRLISVWSPTFWLALLDELHAARPAIAAALAAGDWAPAWEQGFGPMPAHPAPRSSRAAAVLADTGPEIGPGALAALWPRLRLISAWDSATSATFAALLRQRMPAVAFQGKGLWATEGVVTIPFEDAYPAALTSHFLEFRCLDSGRIHPVWELRPGQSVQPLLTTSAGLLRYALDDGMEVTGTLGRTPCLRFAGRLGGEDLVGEKMSARLARAAMREIEHRAGVRALCLCAVNCGPDAPRYVLLAEPAPGFVGIPRAEELLERRLRDLHHYALARDARQLAVSRCVVRPDARAVHARLLRDRVAVEGAAKLEAIVVVDRPGAAEDLLGPHAGSALSEGTVRCASS